MIASHLRAQAPALSSLPRRLLLAASLSAVVLVGPAAAMGASIVSHAAAAHPASAPHTACVATMSGCTPVRL